MSLPFAELLIEESSRNDGRLLLPSDRSINWLLLAWLVFCGVANIGTASGRLVSAEDLLSIEVDELIVSAALMFESMLDIGLISDGRICRSEEWS